MPSIRPYYPVKSTGHRLAFRRLSSHPSSPTSLETNPTTTQDNLPPPPHRLRSVLTLQLLSTGSLLMASMRGGSARGVPVGTLSLGSGFSGSGTLPYTLAVSQLL